MMFGLPIMKIVTYGAGAGLSGLIGQQVSKIGVIPSNLAEPVAGLAMVMFGRKIHPIVKDLGVGILIKEVGDLIEKNVVVGLGTSTDGTWSW